MRPAPKLNPLLGKRAREGGGEREEGKEGRN